MAGGGRNSIAFPLTIIAIGAALLLKEFGYLRGNILRYWPALLIIWGVGMLWAARKG